MEQPKITIAKQIRNQRHALRRIGRDPAVVYLGYETLAELRMEVEPYLGPLTTRQTGETTIYGLAVKLREEPGVHVCEAAP